MYSKFMIMLGGLHYVCNGELLPNDTIITEDGSVLDLALADEVTINPPNDATENLTKADKVLGGVVKLALLKC